MLLMALMHSCSRFQEDLGLNHPPISVLCFTLNRIFIIERKIKQKKIINNYHLNHVALFVILFFVCY